MREILGGLFGLTIAALMLVAVLMAFAGYPGFLGGMMTVGLLWAAVHFGWFE